MTSANSFSIPKHRDRDRQIYNHFLCIDIIDVLNVLTVQKERECT
jgi:hypothetical protein